jgi:hypothetical protein
MLRKPWPVISDLSYPSRRSAAFTVFSLMGRSPVRRLGKTYLPLPVRGYNSLKTATAW